MSALSTFKVLELAESVAGEYCGKLLSDFGAQVIKIEKPGLGSPTRRLSPFATGRTQNDGTSVEHSGLFAYLNTGKQSVELDLSSASGVDALGRMLERVDVVIDDHAAGFLHSAGIDPATCHHSHSRLVVCAITAYGQSPCEERTHAEDLNVFHASGWGYHTPSAPDESLPPLKGAGRYMVSYEAALDAALCIVAALHERAASGQGRFIDISKQQVMASRVDYVLGQMVNGDMDVSASRTAFDLAGPAGIFRCRDGYAYIWMSAPAHWEALRKLLGSPKWMEAFSEHWMEKECTPERVATCRRHLAEWLKTQAKEHAAAEAQKLGLTLVAVNDARDLKASPQYAYRGYFAEVNHPVLGRVTHPTVPYKLNVTPAKIQAPAPLLGQHTAMSEDSGDRGASMNNGDIPQNSRARGGPLQGVRVVELTKVWAGPYVGKLLAFLGAEVIRVESMGSLDVTRTYGVADINNAPGFQAVNPQKLSVQIDMKTPQGIALILGLLAKSDVVVENLRPGAIDRLGLGYAAVRSARRDIVYVSMGMFGNEGPLSYQTGYAPCFAALGGVSALVGYEGKPPSGMNVRYADSTFGSGAAFAAVVALLHRRRTGAGQFIDVSAVESMSSMIGDTIMDFALNGVVHDCDGNRHPEMAPHGVYPCRSGEWISIAVASENAWQALAHAMGKLALARDVRFSTLANRKRNESELEQLLAAWTATQDARQLAGELQRLGVAAARSQSSVDLVADQDLWARGFFREVTDSAGRTRSIVGPSWQMTRGADIRDAAPRLGEHNGYVLGEILGLSASKQQELAAAGITR